MNQPDKNIIELWIEKANHDLTNVSMILEINPMILDIACFHCQQAVEKFLKAFLLFNDQELIKTHNLDILLKKCGHIEADFLNIDVKNLDDYAVNIRYPEYIAPGLSEAKEYYQ